MVGMEYQINIELSFPSTKKKIMIIIVYTMQLLAAEVQIYSYLADLY